MSSLKQRLESLERSSGDGQMTHDEWVLHWMDKPSLRDPSEPEITDAQVEEFLRPTHNVLEKRHAKP